MTVEPTSNNYGFTRRLARTRLATRLAVVAERLWPLVLPLLIVALLFFSASWFGLFRALPDAARIGLAGIFALCILAALYPLRYFRQPTTAEIDRRIEGANQLAHQPVLAQTDRLGSKPDVFADALWRAHQNRMAEKLRNLTGDSPRARIPERDPWGLRAAAPLLALVALAFSYGPSGGRLSDVFNAHAGVAAVPPRIDAWVTPPAYTGKAPIFLTAENNRDVASFTVPSGSDVTVRVTGGSGDETLAYADAAGMTRAIEPADKAPADKTTGEAAAETETANVPRQFAGKLATNGVLSLRSGETELNKWAFSVIVDKPPSIRFSNEPKRAINGSLELHYEISDDYGAASAVGEIDLADAQLPKARPLYAAPELPLTLPRRGAEPPVAKTTRDLTEHVWAGARVKLTLQTADAAKQEARSETKTFTLPERTFTNPLAKALIEQRRIIGLDANRRPWVLTLMDAITLRPEDTFDAMSHYIAIMSARTRLKMAESDDELRGVADYLWEIALGIENGELSEAEKRLRQAQEALKQALERGASDEEIDKLMKELRQAMNEFLREFAERQRNNKNLPELPPDTQMLSQSDIEKMLDQLEEMAKSGDKQSAQELLSQLEQMMQNLQAGRPQQGESGQQSEARKQMNKLGEIMRRQQEMMNETFRTERGQRGEGEGEQGEGGQGENGEPRPGQNGKPMTPGEFAEAMKQLQQGQGELQKELDALQKGLRGMGIQPGEGFGEAGEQMGQAEGALGDQQGERATGHQGRALEALRKGAQDMMQQLQAMQGDEGGSESGGRQSNADRDPLGRPNASTGPDDGSDVKVPGEIDAQRARRILEAIRERLGNALSPELERSYLERLLEMK